VDGKQLILKNKKINAYLYYPKGLFESRSFSPCERISQEEKRLDSRLLRRFSPLVLPQGLRYIERVWSAAMHANGNWR
jgi:hypothetical protein